jgi:hypothetical protein
MLIRFDMPQVLVTLMGLANLAEKQNFPIKWKKEAPLEFSRKEIQAASKLTGKSLLDALKSL